MIVPACLRPRLLDAEDVQATAELGRVPHGNHPDEIRAQYANQAGARADGQQLTVACLLHGDATFKEHLARSLEHQDIGFELILKRNDDNHTALACFFNQVLERARHERILFCHPDIEFSPWGLRNLLQVFADRPDCGATGFVGTTLQGLFVFGRARSLPRRVSTLDSCAILVDRRHGLLFDGERFDGFHCVVEDYCLQLQRLGRTVYVAPGISFAHWGATILLNDDRRATWQADSQRYAERLSDKWGGLPYCTPGSGWDRQTREIREYHDQLLSLFREAVAAPRLQRDSGADSTPQHELVRQLLNYHQVVTHRYEKEMKRLTSSYAYRIGNLLMKPASLLRRLGNAARDCAPGIRR
ncbi:MAG: hypothetical protein AB7K24_16130 [Gemmataceae bacterium]